MYGGTKIRLSILGPGQVFGDIDVILCRKFTTTLKCIENNSEGYIMEREHFLRLFKTNEEAWKIMFKCAQEKEKDIYNRCNNFMKISATDQ